MHAHRCTRLSPSPHRADPPHRGIPQRLKRARGGVRIQIYWASGVNGRSPGNGDDRIRSQGSLSTCTRSKSILNLDIPGEGGVEGSI